MHVNQKTEARQEDAKEWAAITLCLSSALGTYLVTLSGGFSLGLSIELSFIVWILIGSWLADWFRPWNRETLSGQSRFTSVSPLSKAVLQAAMAMMAAYALYALSKVLSEA